MSDDIDREDLKAILAELDEAEAAIDRAKAPFDMASRAIFGAKELLLERFETALYGRCMTCNDPLFDGDQGHPGGDEDGPYCAKCTPSWGDIKRHWGATDPGDDEDLIQQRNDALEAADAHVKAGGSLDDKVLYTLG